MKIIKYIDIKNELTNNSIGVNSNLDNNVSFKNISPITSSKIDDITFFSNTKYLETLKQVKAKACLIKEEYAKFLPKKCAAIIIEEPYLALAIISKLFVKNIGRKKNIISKNIFRDPDCKIHKNVDIGDYCYLANNTEIWDNVTIGHNSKIGPNVIIKKDCIIYDNVSISDAIIMEGCEIKSGARIGNSGFGFEEKTKEKIYHHGNVVIEKNTTIGSNTTIDRAVFDSTTIGENSQIDNLVQIAHNVKIGKHAIIASQVGIAGSTNIGNYVKIGGQAGISGHLYIGNNVTIAGKSGVTKNIDDNKVVAGFPAKDINKWKREIIKMSNNK